MSSPRLIRSASSALRATVTVTPTSTSGCTAMAIVCLPMVLIGASSITWLRLMLTLSASKEAMMSRTDTEPNSWPASEAWRRITTLRPSIFPATLVASFLASRLRASRSAFMPSNLARLSVVARSALPRFSRKLRANPSLTRTTSPIWPSLATRSSRMTSMFRLLMLCRVDLRGKVRTRGGRRPALQIALAESEHGVSKTEAYHRQDGPADHQHHGVGAAEPYRAAFHRQRQRMKHGEADQGVGHHQSRADDLRQHRGQSPDEAQRERQRQRSQRQWRQRRGFKVRPWPVQPSRGRGDLSPQPQIERQRHHRD